MSSHAIFLQSMTDPGRILEQTVSTSNDEKTEEWLQELIFARPEILPVQEFDPDISELIPIARELGTAAGPIDDVFLTASARLVIVETKLWKNPEKHRSVVAQVLDYAKEVSRWTYDQLDQAVLQASRARRNSAPSSLTQIIDRHAADKGVNSAEFQERVIDNLDRGRFLILIVGDKISPNLALLGDTIHGAPGHDFELGLVELCMYPAVPGQSWPLLITGDVVGRTVEYRRAVVTVQYKQEKPQVVVQVQKEIQDASSQRGKTTLTAISSSMPPEISPIFDAAIVQWQAAGHRVFVGSVGMTFRYARKGNPTTAAEVYPDSIAVYRPDDFKDRYLSPELNERYLEKVRTVSAAQRTIAQQRRQVRFDDITAADFATILDASLEWGKALAD